MTYFAQLILLNNAAIEDHGVTMPKVTPSSDFHSKLQSDVVEWLDSSSSVPAEFIIQADLPRRSVAVSKGASRIRQLSIASGDSAERQVMLSKLASAVHGIVEKDIVVLKAAGAVVVSASADELKQILLLPNVREVRFNRKLR